MNKRMLAIILLYVLIFITAGCIPSKQNNNSNNKASEQDPDSISENVQSGPGENMDRQTTEERVGPEQQKPQEPQSDDGGEKIMDVVNKMSLDEKIGQMFIVGFEGYEPNDSLRKMIMNNYVGGVILFRRNIKNPEQLLGLINSIKSINSVDIADTGAIPADDTAMRNTVDTSNGCGRIPIFISVDEEGGSVSRMPVQYKAIPSCLSIGKINDAELSYNIGGLLAKEVKSVGFNMNFAPVLDIWSNPQNTVIGDRSFGSTAEIVSSLGVQTMKGLSGGGVIPVVKHFPGHGDTVVDSHIGLPEVEYNMERLKSFELVPFQAAIENKADAVMIAHILMNSIDAENPSTLSKAVITDLLRDRMGFDGVVITDDMTMGAILKNYNVGDAAVKSVAAGSDIILVCHGFDKQQEAIDALRAAVNVGVIPEERINESVYRILKLKGKYDLSDEPVNFVDVDGVNEKIDELIGEIGERIDGC